MGQCLAAADTNKDGKISGEEAAILAVRVLREAGMLADQGASIIEKVGSAKKEEGQQ